MMVRPETRDPGRWNPELETLQVEPETQDSENGTRDPGPGTYLSLINLRIRILKYATI